ncbi:MAG: ankyrin repeat domain-containing protein [Armatimonadetes bacterium]|nr:ankyrin repeat domain-containing protein [Armatimonadota bacterium]
MGWKAIIVMAGFLLSVNLVGQTDPGHQAVPKWDLKAIKGLLKRNPHWVNAQNEYGRSPIHYSVIYGRKDVIKLLLCRGAHINAKDRDGMTPLHLSAIKGDEVITRFLIAHGAKVNVKTVEGVTPLHIAAGNGRNTIAAILLDKGAMIDTQDQWGRTPLHYTIDGGEGAEIKLVLLEGVDVMVPRKWGQPPFKQIRIEERQEALAALLIAQGARVNVKTKTGRTPLDTAEAKGRTAMIMLLRQHGGQRESPQ